MKRRCHNPRFINFRNYGARGIAVCERWRNSFTAFLEDMGACPDGLELERIDNEKGYEPGNCRWASRKEQCRNSRKNHFITANGKTLPLSQWSEETGVRAATIRRRIRVLKMSPEQALQSVNYRHQGTK
jgi:hypothetical protein